MMSVSPAPVLCRLLLVLLFVGALHAQTRPDFLGFTSWMMDLHFVPPEATEPQFISLARDGEHKRLATLDHTTQLTDIVDSAEMTSVSFNRTVCTTKCWRGSSCPRKPNEGCAVVGINFFALFANATYGGPCGANGGAWWNSTVPTTPAPLREAVCFSYDGRVPLYFAFAYPSGETEAPSFVKVSHFVLGTPPPALFKIPATCPCAGTNDSF